MRNKHFVILLHNFKGIYAVLSRIWKCRKSRVFGANLCVQNTAGATSFAFCNYEGKIIISDRQHLFKYIFRYFLLVFWHCFPLFAMNLRRSAREVLECIWRCVSDMPDNTYRAIHNGNTKRYTMETQMLDATAKYIQSDIKDNMDH